LSAIARVRRARLALAAFIVVKAVLWAAAATAAVVLAVVLGDMWLALSFEIRRFVVPALLSLAAGSAAFVLWRGRRVRSLTRVALFIEERIPTLRFALVTALGAAGEPGADTLERIADELNLRGALLAPVARALLMPAALLAASLVALGAAPRGALERALHPRVGDVILRPAGPALLASRLEAIAVRLEPPGYARRSPTVLENPSSVRALVGSRITVRGRGAALGAADSLSAMLGDSVWMMSVQGDTWSATTTMPAKASALRLTDRRYDRLLVLEPVIDEPPEVKLRTPERDSVYAEAKGTLLLSAELRDDVGLARAHFELLHTTGGGEGFQTRRSVTGGSTLRGMATSTIRATVRLDTMELGPGDVLNVRAIAWDENDVTGPGKGESDTRTIRILDPTVKDSVNVNPAAAAALDTSILSQRMLIMRADSLAARKSSIAAQDFVVKALDLGVRQGDLRNRLLSIVYDLEHVQGVGFVGETPSSKILKEAGDAMLEAETELKIAALSTARPHMWRALRLLQEARNDKRYWLRGLLLNDPVEVDRLRLTGTDPMRVASRQPREHDRDARASLLARVDRVLSTAGAAGAIPVGESDSLKLILVGALEDAPDIADPLRRAIDAMAAGGDPRLALLQARRRLQRGTVSDPTLSQWNGGS
jgi:hypothetical protein